ncbi:MAG: insulinase family protein [Paracoccaceae bacterium]
MSAKRRNLFGAVLGVLSILAVGWVVHSWSGSGAMHRVHHVQGAIADRVKVQVVLPIQHDGYDNAHPLAHYTEHLAWLSAMGGSRDPRHHSNAWTNSHAVGYWLSGPSEDVSDILEKLFRVFEPFELPQNFAAEERSIVLREYDSRIRSNTAAQAGQEINAFLYQGNTIATSVIGTPDQIRSFTYEDAKGFHAATHRPENATLIVTGDVSKRDIRRVVEQAGWHAPGDPLIDVATPSFDLAETDSVTLRYPDASVSPRLIWRRTVELPEPVPFDVLEAQTALLRSILDTNLTGGIAGPLRYDAAFARSFSINIWPIDEDNIELQFTAAPDRDISLSALQAAFENAMSEITAEGIPEDTFNRVLERFDGFWPDWTDTEETTEWMASYVMDRVSALRDPLPEHELKRLDQYLSLESTNALLLELAGDGRTATAFMGPEEVFE